MLACLCLLAGGVLRFVPPGTPISAVARVLDSLAPWFLALALARALSVIWLGLRRVGAGLAGLALASSVHLVWGHVALSLPRVPDTPADLRVVFFNVLGGNAAFSHRIVEAAIALDPDIIVFAEGTAVYPALPALRGAHAFVSPCDLDRCELLVATRAAPVRFWRLSLNAAWEDRYAVTEVETRTGKRVFVAASHLVKPWLDGVSEPEHARLAAQYDWLQGPVVAVGDFNAAPWSHPMQSLLERTGFHSLRRPFPSWPARAGRLGIPIDHLLVHNGARVVAITPFGDGFGSNHRGFYADIALP